MKIKKPNIPIELDMIENLFPVIYESKTEETDIVKKHIKDAYLTKEDLSGIRFCSVIFENCKFIDCKIEKTSFLDVVFKNCDLSNSNLCDGYFNRCELFSSKWMGVNLYGNGFQQLAIVNCNFQYANFDNSNLNYVTISESDMSNASLTECKLKNLEIYNTQFINTNFFKTPLKGIDFTQSNIEHFIISDSYAELNGAIVNAFQAVDLAKLLGVVVK